MMLYDLYEVCYPRESERWNSIRQSDPFNDLHDKKFVVRFRLSKNVVLQLLHEV